MHTDPTQTTSQTPRPSFVIRSGTSPSETLFYWEERMKRESRFWFRLGMIQGALLAIVVMALGLSVLTLTGCSLPDTVDGLPPAKAEPVSMMTDFDDRPAWMLYLLHISSEPEFKRC